MTDKPIFHAPVSDASVPSASSEVRPSAVMGDVSTVLETPPMRDESHMSRIARRKLGAPPEWELCGWERVGTDGVLITGGIPRLLKSGPSKGKKTWRDSEITKAVVTKGEEAIERAAYEASTGNCGECLGSGKTWAGWKLGEGSSYRQCRDCSGTGKC
jgi:hypothetical protein